MTTASVIKDKTGKICVFITMMPLWYIVAKYRYLSSLSYSDLLNMDLVLCIYMLDVGYFLYIEILSIPVY